MRTMISGPFRISAKNSIDGVQLIGRRTAADGKVTQFKFHIPIGRIGEFFDMIEATAADRDAWLEQKYGASDGDAN